MYLEKKTNYYDIRSKNKLTLRSTNSYVINTWYSIYTDNKV